MAPPPFVAGRLQQLHLPPTVALQCTWHIPGQEEAPSLTRDDVTQLLTNFLEDPDPRVRHYASLLLLGMMRRQLPDRYAETLRQLVGEQGHTGQGLRKLHSSYYQVKALLGVLEEESGPG